MSARRRQARRRGYNLSLIRTSERSSLILACGLLKQAREQKRFLL